MGEHFLQITGVLQFLTTAMWPEARLYMMSKGHWASIFFFFLNKVTVVAKSRSRPWQKESFILFSLHCGPSENCPLKLIYALEGKLPLVPMKMSSLGEIAVSRGSRFWGECYSFPAKLYLNRPHPIGPFFKNTEEQWSFGMICRYIIIRRYM